MRFRKSMSICKGVRLNFSKSGVSCTVGGKGISANLGKKGVFLNTSIPGTGLYDRKKIVDFDGTGKPGKAASGRQRPMESLPAQVQLQLEEDGSLLVFDEAGMLIEDEAVLRKLERTASYRASYAECMEEYKKQEEDKTDVFVNIGQMSADVPTADDYAWQLEQARPEAYQAATFPDPAPTREGIRAWLEAEANKNVQSLAFWNIQKKRDDYVQANLAKAYNEEYDAWVRRKAAFDADQDRIAVRENARFQKEYEQMMEAIRRGMSGDRDDVEDQIEAWLGSLELPVDFQVQFEYDDDSGLLSVDMDLPEIQHLPETKVVELASGKAKAKAKTQKELKQEYAQCVFGLGMFCASHFFCVTSNIEKILLSGYTQRRNQKTGDVQEDYIYSVIFDREPFEKEGYQRENPQDFICRFKNRMNMLASGNLNRIEPYSQADVE